MFIKIVALVGGVLSMCSMSVFASEKNDRDVVHRFVECGFSLADFTKAAIPPETVSASIDANAGKIVLDITSTSGAALDLTRQTLSHFDHAEEVTANVGLLSLRLGMIRSKISRLRVATAQNPDAGVKAFVDALVTAWQDVQKNLVENGVE